MTVKGPKIVKLLNFGEVRKIREQMADYAELQAKIDNNELAETDAQIELNKLISKSDESDKMVAEVLSRCMNLSQKQLDDMDYSEAVSLFRKLYTESTTVKKNSSQPYG